MPKSWVLYILSRENIAGSFSCGSMGKGGVFEIACQICLQELRSEPFFLSLVTVSGYMGRAIPVE
jgi:hypothetical protein